jgi:prepilin-type N-terminal cleavage/methylation domain-containing protein
MRRLFPLRFMRLGRLRRGAGRGYTLVELLMSITVLAFGVSGVIAMQRVTLASNRQSKDLAVATRIAEAWADQLAADGMLWSLDTGGTSTRSRTTWLQLANPSGIVDWFLPPYSSTRAFGPAFGPLGAPRDPAVRPEQSHFCAHLRLAFLKSETLPNPGNGLIRAQVRVFWKRESPGLATLPAADICAIDDATFKNNLGAFHVVYLTTAVRQQMIARAQ